MLQGLETTAFPNCLKSIVAYHYDNHITTSTYLLNYTYFLVRTTSIYLILHPEVGTDNTYGET